MTVMIDDNSPVSTIEAVARARLSASPYAAIRKIFCLYDEGVLILRGRLPTFFHKQVALAAVINIHGVRQIANQIQVSEWSD